MPKGRVWGWRTGARGQAGTAAIEFALVLPVLMLLLVGVVDIGRALLTQYRLSQAVSAGAQYALINNAMVTSSSGVALATAVATVLANAVYTGWAAVGGQVVVNNGPVATLSSSGTITVSGTAANANNFYCPTGTSPSTLVWTAGTQGTACSGGAYAGQFVSITASAAYAPLFSTYGLVPAGALTQSAVVQTQ